MVQYSLLESELLWKPNADNIGTSFKANKESAAFKQQSWHKKAHQFLQETMYVKTISLNLQFHDRSKATLYNVCPTHCQWPAEAACDFAIKVDSVRSSFIVALALYALFYGSVLFDYFKINGIDSHRKLIHSPLCWKTRMQANCALTDWLVRQLKLAFRFGGF